MKPKREAKQGGNGPLARFLPPAALEQFALNAITNSVAHATVDYKLLLLAAPGLRWIGKGPVSLLSSTRKDRAGITSCVTHGNHFIKRLSQITVQGLGRLSRDIDAQFMHHTNGKRTNRCRFRSRTIDLELVASKLPQQALSHLRASRIMGTEKEHTTHHPGLLLSSEPAGRSLISPLEYMRSSGVPQWEKGSGPTSGAMQFRNLLIQRRQSIPDKRQNLLLD